jgi:DNA polymerase V
MITNTCFALVDGDNFFVSCERVFNPGLIGRPVVVLSSNDGCIVARSMEAKRLNVKMGAPYFQHRDVLEHAGAAVLSSNFTLYGDMSSRMMSILMHCAPMIEVYSIDEAFLDLSSCVRYEDHNNITGFARAIRERIVQWTGLPVSIGIAPTKTLAKIAAQMAKHHPDLNGVGNLMSASRYDEQFEQIDIQEVWGIGWKSAERLRAQGISTARHLLHMNESSMRRIMGINGVRLLQEMRGVPCFTLEEEAAYTQSVTSSRSFGRRVDTLIALQEAVAAHVASAARKLRSQRTAARMLTVFVLAQDKSTRRSAFVNRIVPLVSPTHDTPELLHYATHGVREIFQEGFLYKKAGVTCADIVPEDQIQADLFDTGRSRGGKQLMATIDRINATMGAHTIKYAAEGLTQSWRAKIEKRSARYTTNWNELLNVFAR